MDSAFPLRFFILQAIKSWTVGRPGNEASTPWLSLGNNYKIYGKYSTIVLVADGLISSVCLRVCGHLAVPDEACY